MMRLYLQDLIRLDQRVRFLLAGGFASGVSWASRFLFNTVMPFALAVATATALGMVIGFLIYRSFVFPGSSRSLAAPLGGFLLVNLIGGLVTVAVAIVARDGLLMPLGLTEIAAPAAHAIGIMAGAVANYIGHKTVTFRTA